MNKVTKFNESQIETGYVMLFSGATFKLKFESDDSPLYKEMKVYWKNKNIMVQVYSQVLV